MRIGVFPRLNSFWGGTGAMMSLSRLLRSRRLFHCIKRAGMDADAIGSPVEA
jgi:hypothetical protein